MTFVFLPATSPSDKTYGEVPGEIAGFTDASIHVIQYPDLVWYNKSVQDEAISQIHSLHTSSVVLIGFSKSGLGAWNIARTIPELVSATIIFDAPVARPQLPPWKTAPFYADDSSWREDLPITSVRNFSEVMPETHQLVLISGKGFHKEMLALSRILAQVGYKHEFLARPNMIHHWNSGWIKEGLKALKWKGDT